MYYIVKATPSEKRIVYVDNINKDTEMWKDDDELLNYEEETKKTIFQSVIDGAAKGAEIGEDIGGIFGETGRRIGHAVGKFLGGVKGLVEGLFG